MGSEVMSESPGEPRSPNTGAAGGSPSSKGGGDFFRHVAADLDQLDLFRPRFIQVDLLGDVQ